MNVTTINLTAALSEALTKKIALNIAGIRHVLQAPAGFTLDSLSQALKFTLFGTN